MKLKNNETDGKKIDIFISVIVPVYNAEQYLKTCLDSLISQTYTNFEVYNGYFKTKRRYAWSRLMEYLGTGCPDTQ